MIAPRGFFLSGGHSDTYSLFSDEHIQHFVHFLHQLAATLNTIQQKKSRRKAQRALLIISRAFSPALNAAQCCSMQFANARLPRARRTHSSLNAQRRRTKLTFMIARPPP